MVHRKTAVNRSRGSPRQMGMEQVDIAPVSVDHDDRRKESTPRETVWELARSERNRLVRHPVTILATGLAALFSVIYAVESDTNTFVAYIVLTNMPLAAGTSILPILGVLLASRARKDRTTELDDSLPAAPGLRNASHIVAFGWLGAITAGAIGLCALATRAWEGLPVWMEPNPGSVSRDYTWIGSVPVVDVVPSLPELLQGPMVVVVMGSVGLAVGHVIPTRWTIAAIVPMSLTTWVVVGWNLGGDVRWFLPFVDASQYVGDINLNGEDTYGVVQGFDVAALNWHLVYLTGIVTVISALLVGSWRGRSVQIACASGALAVVVGGILQVSTAVGNLP